MKPKRCCALIELQCNYLNLQKMPPLIIINQMLKVGIFQEHLKIIGVVSDWKRLVRFRPPIPPFIQD